MGSLVLVRANMEGDGFSRFGNRLSRRRCSNVKCQRDFDSYRAARDYLLFNTAFILAFLYLSFFTDFAPLRLKKPSNEYSGPFLR
jgi:hypothetical protein